MPLAGSALFAPRCRTAVHRGELREQAPPLHQTAEALLTHGGGAAGAADHHHLRDALVSLPDEQRTVLLLGYFEGLSSSEIAERIGIPTGTVKSRVAAAMAKLRAKFAEDAS